MNEFAKFTGTLGKLSIGDTDCEFKLTIPLKDAQKNFMFLTNNQKQKVIVSLGDPQVSMEFPDEEEQREGLRYVADRQGVVEVENGSSQPDLFDQAETAETDTTAGGSDVENDFPAGDAEEPDYSGKEIVITQTYRGIREELIEIVFPIIEGEAGLPSFYLDKRFDRRMDEREVLERIGAAPIPRQDSEVRYLVSELLGVFGGELRDVDPAAGEMTEEDEQLVDSLPDPEGELEDWENEILLRPPAESDQDLQQVDIEAIILTEKPQYDDIPYDFPTLLARRKAGETWIEIASSIGTRSNILSNAWAKYKKRVADQRGGAA